MMSEFINLKEIERKAFRSYFQDGLWDLYLGAMLLVMGSGLVIGGALESRGGNVALWSIPIMIALVAVLFGAFWAAEKHITVPRLGLVKFGPGGRVRRVRVTIVASVSVLVGLVIFFSILSVTRSDSPQRALLGAIVPVVYSLNMLLVFGLWGYFWSFERLYLIGLLYALPLPLMIGLDELLGIRIGYAAFAIPAAIILAMGAVVFIRFLRDYPLSKERLNVGDEH
jgi:hypothetical protein